MQKFKLLCLVAFLTLLLPSCQAQVNVETQKVQTAKIRRLLRFTGETRPFVEAFAAADVMGPVAKINVEDGERVEKGQVLANIDEIRFEIALRMSQAALERAKHQLAEDQKDFERNKTLFDKGAITQKTFDMAETVLIKAKTSLKQAQAEFDRAKLDLERCAIRAPIDGFFVDRSIEIGQAMNRGQNMGKVIFLDEIYVDAKVGENDVRLLKIGQSCIVEEKFSGTVAFINHYADQSRAFKVRIRMPNKPMFFKANMYVKGSFVIEEYPEAPLFSSRAIRNSRGEQFVFTVKDGTARKVPITIVAQESDMTYAKEIEPGMEIVTIGQDNLEDGARVSLRNGKN